MTCCSDGFGVFELFYSRDSSCPAVPIGLVYSGIFQRRAGFLSALLVVGAYILAFFSSLVKRLGTIGLLVVFPSVEWYGFNGIPACGGFVRD